MNVRLDHPKAPKPVTVLISSEEFKGFSLAVLTEQGVRSDVAHHVSDGLVEASLRGVDSHGIRLLPHYIRALTAGRLNPNPDFQFQRTAASTGILDGDHTFGHASGSEGMRHAMELARESGMGAVAVKNSSHFGAAAYFSLMAARQGMIGLSFTHADSLVLSHGGVRPFFGTNPICFAAPCVGEEPFCLDMATSTVTWNKALKIAGDGGLAPIGWGVDATGQDTTDPSKFAALLPIGGYKGFGLGMVVDILCGALTGMPFGRHISRMYADPIEQQRRLGHFFMAIKTNAFLPSFEFESCMQAMMEEIRCEIPLDSTIPVQVPGDPEKRAFTQRSESGIPLSQLELDEMMNLAARCGKKFPTVSEEAYSQ